MDALTIKTMTLTATTSNTGNVQVALSPSTYTVVGAGTGSNSYLCFPWINANGFWSLKVFNNVPTISILANTELTFTVYYR